MIPQATKVRECYFIYILWYLLRLFTTSQEPQILLVNLTLTTASFLRNPEKVTVS
jgi:hypothetical protein